MRPPRAKPPRARRSPSPAPSPPPRASVRSARILGSGPPRRQPDVIRRPRSRPALCCPRTYSRPGGCDAASPSFCFSSTTFLNERDAISASELLRGSPRRCPSCGPPPAELCGAPEMRRSSPAEPPRAVRCAALLSGMGRASPARLPQRRAAGSAFPLTAAGICGTPPCRPTDGVDQI